MAAIIISNQNPYAWGQLTNRMIGGVINANTNIQRLNDAIATASAGFSGTPGTQFEIPAAGTMGGAADNLFGVQASDTPGENGQTYSYAVGRLQELWATFWADAQQYVEQLDNGQFTM